MIKLTDIAKTIDAIEIVGVSDREINQMKSIDDVTFSYQDLAWCSDKNLKVLASIDAGNVLLSPDAFAGITPKDSISYIIVSFPRKAFQKVLTSYFVEEKKFGFIHPSASVDPSVIYVANQVNIGPNVVLEKGVVLGEKVTIGANSVIKSNTILRDDVTIGCNTTIGGVGFGYEPNEIGEYELIPHIGNVILSKGVEIGNNVCIDRAVLGSTFLDENVKVDNLVHIAHGVQIGKNSLVIAHAMIAGSVKIGENVWVAPSSSIRQKLNVEDNSIIGMGAVVVKNVNKNETVAGNPAKIFQKK